MFRILYWIIETKSFWNKVIFLTFINKQDVTLYFGKYIYNNVSKMFTKLVKCFIQLDCTNFYYYIKITVQRLELSCLSVHC